MKTIQYKAFFENQYYSTEVEIKNDHEYLTFELDGFKFEGSTFHDFEMLNYNEYRGSKQEKFSINEISCGEKCVAYEICEYKMTVFLPVQIIDFETEEIIYSEMEMKINSGKSLGRGFIESVWTQLTLNILGEKIVGEDYDFEGAANKILKKIKTRFTFRNCFGCKFSDYSYMGSSEFGTMLCFKNQKEKYIKVKSKSDYMKLDREDKVVQEIYACDEYEIRGNITGYRG